MNRTARPKASKTISVVMSRPSDEEAVHDALISRLQSLRFCAFEQCVQQLLVAMGYAGAHLLGRVHFKGRNRNGGSEIEVFSTAGVTRLRVLVQVKQFSRTVQKRYVDELRGTMLRTGARQGLLLTTSTFSNVAKAAAADCCVAPIRLVDGAELAQLLIAHHLGVREEYVRRVCIDELFFEQLASGTAE